MARRIDEKTVAHYVKLRRELGFNMSRAAREAGVSRTWAYQFERDNPLLGGGVQYAKAARRGEVPKPLERSELSDVALRCLDDFGFFREHLFARNTTPWQEDAAYRIVEFLEDRSQKSFVVINVPPGAGKTTTFTHDVPAWLVARDRRIRMLLGSHGARVATSYSRRLRVSLERPTPHIDPQRDVEAKGTMAHLFGRFKPEHTDLWRAEQFIVDQLGGVAVGEKEPTCTAVGQDTGFLGGRFEFNMWDDLVTPGNQLTVESREKQQEFWTDQAETRCEPGGVVLLMGQRLRADDLYRFALDMRLPVDEFDPGPSTSQQPRKYFHIVYPAHVEEVCEGVHKPGEADYWRPDDADSGCLLDPARLPWRELAAVKENNPKKYRTVYQQEDTDAEGVLVQERWLEGGLGADGVRYEGCYDYDRSINEWPSNLPSCDISAVTVDPSPSKFWSIQWWGYSIEADVRVLINHERTRMRANDLLDFQVHTRQYSGLLVDWVEIGRRIGVPITHMIVEQNAAQKFMDQYDYYDQFTRKHGILRMPHNTHSNKADPDYGVWASLPGPYRHGKVRLPWKPGFGRRASQPLVNEVTKWPESATEDCVMSQWFFEFKLPHIHIP